MIGRIIRKLLGVDLVLAQMKVTDSRVAELEKCVARNKHDYGQKNFVSTGNWNH